MAHKKDWKIIDDLYACSNAIRLLLNTGKLVKKLLKCILFLQNMILNRAMRSISYDNRQFLFCFEQSCCLWVLSTHIGNVLRMSFSENNLMQQLNRRKYDPEIPKCKFSVLFLGWKNPKSKHMGLSFNYHLKHLILKVAVWLSGIALCL